MRATNAIKALVHRFIAPAAACAKAVRAIRRTNVVDIGRGRILVFLFSALLPFAVHATQEPAPLIVEVHPEKIIVGGLTSGEIASILVVARDESDRWPVVTRRHEQIADSDGDGVVHLKLDAPLPFASVVVAVDESDGRFALATPGPLAKTRSGADQLISDGQKRPVRFSALIDRGVALLVRPRKGVWVLPFSEGGTDDADGAVNHQATIAFDRLKSKSDLKGPDHLLPKDVLIVVDTSRLEVFLHSVKEDQR